MGNVKFLAVLEIDFKYVPDFLIDDRLLPVDHLHLLLAQPPEVRERKKLSLAPTIEVVRLERKKTRLSN